VPIQIYDLNTINPPHGVKISSDGNFILTGSVDNKLFLFNKSSSKPMWNISNYYYHFDMSADGTYIVGSGGGDQSIHVLKNYNSTPLWSCNINESVYSVAISSDGKYIVAANRDGNIFLFNTSSSKPLWNYSIGIIVRTLAISYDGEYIVAGTNNGAIGGTYLFNKSGGTPMWHHHIGIQTADLVWCVKLSNDSNYIVAGTGGLFAAPGRIFFYNILNPTPLWSYTVLEGITSLALSSDGRYCVEGDQTKLYFFNTAYAINPLIWSNTQNAVSVDITSNGNYIIAGGVD